MRRPNRSYRSRRGHLLRTRSSWVAMIALMGLLVACGGTETPSTPETPSPTPVIPTPTAMATPIPIAMTPIVWATSINAVDGGPQDVLTEIPTTAPAIYALTRSNALMPGTVIETSWTLDGTPIPALDRSVTVDQDREAGWISFSLNWTAADNWPVGTLAVTVTVNGTATASGSVEIIRP